MDAESVEWDSESDPEIVAANRRADREAEREWRQAEDEAERQAPASEPKQTDERKPLSSFLVNHADTIGMSWQEIDNLRPPAIIERFLRRGEVMLLGAESKSRKSWLTQDAGFCVAAGMPWLADDDGENGFPTTQGRVHVLDLELNPSEMRFRFAKARGNRFADDEHSQAEVTASISAYSFDGLNVCDLVPRLAEVQATVQPGDLVIVDCFYRLVPDGNETNQVATMLETLKRFAAETQAGIILVDHFRKAGDDKARNRFAGSFVKQASASTLVAIEATADDMLVLNIDARTFHGCPKVHARFNLESYAFNRVPDADIQASKDAAGAAEAEGWLVAVWKSRPLSFAAGAADGAEKWGISRQAAGGKSGRFAKLESRGFVGGVASKAGQAKLWSLTPKGVEVIKSALNLHPDLHP
ncbi:MAG: AAA family ATPase [Akkermansiaceae bacterium]